MHINPKGARALHGCLPPDQWRTVVETRGSPGGAFGFVDERLNELLLIEDDVTSGSGDPASSHHSVSRITLHQVLSAGLADVLCLDQEFERYEQAEDGTLACHFAEGTTATADVLVGADGPTRGCAVSTCPRRNGSTPESVRSRASSRSPTRSGVGCPPDAGWAEQRAAAVGSRHVHGPARPERQPAAGRSERHRWQRRVRAARASFRQHHQLSHVDLRREHRQVRVRRRSAVHTGCQACGSWPAVRSRDGTRTRAHGRGHAGGDRDPVADPHLGAGTSGGPRTSPFSATRSTA